MSYGKRPAWRREGAGAKAPECVIAAGRWMGRETRCLVSVLKKRAINSMKKVNLYETHKYMQNKFPHRSTDALEFKCMGPKGTGGACDSSQ